MRQCLLRGLFVGVVCCTTPSSAIALDALGFSSGQDFPVESKLAPQTRGGLVLVRVCNSPVLDNAGLAWDGSHLWLADWGNDRAIQLDPATCTAVRSIPLPGQYPAGLAWDGTHLWHADALLQRIYEIDPSDGTIVSSFPSVGGFPTGLTFDGTDFWGSDPDCPSLGCVPDEVHQFQVDGTAITTNAALGNFPTGFAFDGTHLWHSDNGTQSIYKLDPTTLSVLGVYAAPGRFPNDLAWDGNFLWVLENDTNALYQYEVFDPISTEAASWGRVKSKYVE